MQTAYNKAVEAAKTFEEFEAEHPVATAVFCTVVAIGVLVVFAPEVLEILGFGEFGPIEGEWVGSIFQGGVLDGGLIWGGLM